MNETASRPVPSRANAMAMPAMVSVAMPSGAAGGTIPHEKSPTFRSFPSRGGPSFAICAFRTIRTVADSGRIARTAPRSRIRGPITSPFHVPSAARNERSASETDGRGIDRLLTERSETLALESRVPVSHFAADEERFQAVVGGSREDHAAKNFAALVRRQRRPQGRPPQKRVARREDLIRSLLQSGGSARAGRRVGQAGLTRIGGELAGKRRSKSCAKTVDVVFGSERATTGRVCPRTQRSVERKRVTLCDKGTQLAGKTRELPGLGQTWPSTIDVL